MCETLVVHVANLLKVVLMLVQRIAKSFVWISFALLVADVAVAQIDGDELLNPKRVIEIKIEIVPQDWTRLRRQARNPMTAFSGMPNKSPYTYCKADVWLDGVKIESVGIRKKGFFGSADTLRPSLKIKFDEFKQQEPVKGLSRLTLNNNKQDGSQLSQYLTYRLFRKAGNPAPRSNWAHVTVNGESLGIYSNVESIKKPFLKRVFQDKSGNLYEGTLSDFYLRALENIEVKTNEKENERSDIKRLAEILAGDGDLDIAALAEIIDLDAFYRHWALEGLTGFWDGYSSNQNNYYLYFNPKDNGRGQFIPWGADWVFSKGGPFPFAGFGGNRAPTVIYAQGMIANRLYHSKAGPKRYRRTMRQLLDEFWDENAMLDEVDRVEKLITPMLHRAQEGTSRSMKEIREFIRGRRDVVERALKDWRPSIPPEPRKPAYVVDVGTVTGSFSTTFSSDLGKVSDSSQAEIRVQLGADKLEFNKFTARAHLFQFGAFGSPPGGRTANKQALPINLSFTGERSEGKPVTISVIVDRNLFVSNSGKTIRVTGSYLDGGVGGFGPFGGGPKRWIVGSIRLTKAGTNPGDEINGNAELRIVETHGGIFQRRKSTFGGGAKQTGSLRDAMKPQPLTIQQALDTNRDGTVSAEELEQAVDKLKRFDRNGDGKLTVDELYGRSTRLKPQKN